MIQLIFALLRNPVFLLGAILFGTAAFYYNRLIRLQATVDTALEALERALIKRKELVPELKRVTTLTEFEPAMETWVLPENLPLLEEDLSLRFEEERKLSEQVGQMIEHLREDPRFRNTDGFQRILDRHQDINQQLEVARETYNSHARAFNLRIESFPSAIIASMLQLQRQELFV